MSLSDVAGQITTYLGAFLLVSGIVGNGINIIVFSTVRNYRTTPCTFYFLIVSIYNFLYVTMFLPYRIVLVDTGFDLSRISIGWCKIRWIAVYTLGCSSLTTSCLATIDQYFITSQSAYLRRFSNIKWTHRVAIIVIIIWCLHGIPLALLFDISSITMACVIINPIFATYLPIFFLIFVCILPVTLMVLFGYLTYRNIQLTRALAEQQADRQLVQMTLIQVLLVIVSIVPYGIDNAYNLITSKVNKDPNRLSIENFALTMTSLWSYFYYSGSCYMFLVSSSRFRRTIKNRILFYLRPNEVNVVQQTINGTTSLINKRNN